MREHKEMAMAYSSTFSSFPYTKLHTPSRTTTTKVGLLPAVTGGCCGARFSFSIAVKSPESADSQPPAATATETPVSKTPQKPVFSSQCFLLLYIYSHFLYKLKLLITVYKLYIYVLLTVKKGQIVRVEKEKYLNSVNVSPPVITLF